MGVLRNLLLSGAFAVTTATAGADRALVIGVSDYRLLGGAKIEGPREDLRLVANAFRGLGFSVALLEGSNTKSSVVLAELRRLAQSATEGEHVVLYFSGLGDELKDRRPTLLTSDSTVDSNSPSVSIEQVRDIMRTSKGSYRLAIIDTSFTSGLRLSSGSVSSRLRIRSFARREPSSGVGGKDLRIVVANDQNGSTARLAEKVNTGVAFLYASRGNEQAFESFGGESSVGVFTQALISGLNAKPNLLGDLLQSVATEVAYATDDLQHPVISAGYESQPAPGISALQAVNSVPNRNKPSTVWEVYNYDQVDPGKLSVRVEPDRTTFKVGDRFRAVATVGQEGYLVLLERGTSGKISLLYPNSETGLSAKRLGAGDKVVLPAEGFDFEPDAPGTERLKAILFERKEDAESLIGKLSGTSVSTLGSKDLRIVRSNRSAYFTSDVIFEIVERDAEEQGMLSLAPFFAKFRY